MTPHSTGWRTLSGGGHETTFAGLRFVRNRMGYHADHADFIQPCVDDAAGGDAPITEWTWRSLPEPAVSTLPPRGQEWELSRYQAYQDVLAGQRVGVTFGRTSDFHDARGAHRAGADAAAGRRSGGRDQWRAPRAASSHMSNAEFLSAL